MNARLVRLLDTHHRIDKALRAELKRRRPDPMRTGQLKTLKLRIKDLIERVTRRAASA